MAPDLCPIPPLGPWFTPFRPCSDRTMGRKKGFTGRTRIDRIDDPGARRLVNDLLRAASLVLTTASGVRRWCCIATAREEGLERLGWLDRAAVRKITTARVPVL